MWAWKAVSHLNIQLFSREQATDWPLEYPIKIYKTSKGEPVLKLDFSGFN